MAKRPKQLDVRLVPIERVRPYKRNPRQNDQAVDAVAASLQQFGFRKPIVVDAKYVIICGHTCFKAAQKLGLKKVPIHVASDLSKKQVTAYRIADNKTSEIAAWDYDLLRIELTRSTWSPWDSTPESSPSWWPMDRRAAATPMTFQIRPMTRSPGRATSGYWAGIGCSAGIPASPRTSIDSWEASGSIWSTRTPLTT